MWIITGEPSRSAAPNPQQTLRRHLNHGVITSCRSPRGKHTEAGRWKSARDATREQTREPATSCQRAFRVPLNVRVSGVVRVCTFQEAPPGVTVPGNKEARPPEVSLRR